MKRLLRAGRNLYEGGRHMFQSKKVFLSAGCLLAVIVFFLAFYVVDQGDRAVVLRFGKIIDTTDPGIHVKIPMVDSVKIMSVRTTKIQDKLSVYSKDVQAAVLIFSLNYTLLPQKVGDVYSNLGLDFERRVIIPQIMDKTKNAFGKFAAVDIIRNRETLAQAILDDLHQQLLPSGIRVQTVQIENIDFSNEYEKSVEERMKAEVAVARVMQDLEREKINADMNRTKARGEADARVFQAEAAAKEIRLKAEAEADAILAKAKALDRNKHYIRMMEVEKWDGRLPKTMVPSGTLPILSLNGAIEDRIEGGAAGAAR
ncbi:MAG: hypothetical protein LBB66_00210 [Desulfovibrio sp.]|nr:hypothetical protein [Desulfovibrio sp.]